jgi:hypothetical protein
MAGEIITKIPAQKNKCCGIMPPAVQTDWERVPTLGIAEGVTPVTAQAQEPSEQANLERVSH